MMIRPALLVLAALVASAAPAAALSPTRLASLTPERVLERTRVVDDPLEFETVISTEAAARSTTGVGASWNDNHLRAAVDRRTGKVRFEVRQAVQYYGAFRDFRRAHYMAPSGLRAVELVRSGEPRDNCLFPDVTGCSQREDVAFEVDEGTLRAAAEDYRPGASGTWTFKLKTAKGDDRLASLPRAEIAGLLRAVDNHRSAPIARAALDDAARME